MPVVHFFIVVPHAFPCSGNINYCLLFLFHVNYSMEPRNNYGTEFSPNRSKRNLLVLYVVCGLFIAVGFIILLAGIAGDHDLIGGGLGMTGFATLLLVLGHFFTSPLNIAYYVGPACILLKQGKKSLEISYADIQSLTHLKEDQSEKFILELQNSLTDRQREILRGPEAENILGQLRNAFSEQKKAFEKFKYLSVAVAYSSSGRSQAGPERASGADLPCDTVFILLKSGEGYFISPLDISGFMNETGKYLPR